MKPDLSRQPLDWQPLSWVGIVRLGLVQTSLGAIVVLTTSAINRVMIVEMALPALIPGLLVALHHAVQMLRPRWGHGSDVGGKLTPWIIGGMAILGLGGILAAAATGLMGTHFAWGLTLGIIAFTLIGIGTGAAGTCLLVLLAKSVEPTRRGAAATVVWLMMIAGFAITAGVVGQVLDPFSPERLLAVTAAVCSAAVLITIAAIWGIEGKHARPAETAAEQAAKPPFRQAIAEVWAEPDARRLTIFVFVSMLVYFSQELVIDPFAGFVFGYTPGQSTKLSSTLHSGVFLGMIALAIGSSSRWTRDYVSLPTCMWAGCLASAAALLGLVACGLMGPTMPLKPIVFLLGCANGVFAVSAIAWMMTLAGRGRKNTEGVRMGLWGAAQGIAAAFGGVFGAGASDLSRWLITDTGSAYALVFALQAAVFIWAAYLAPRPTTDTNDATATPKLVPAE